MDKCGQDDKVVAVQRLHAQKALCGDTTAGCPKMASRC